LLTALHHCHNCPAAGNSVSRVARETGGGTRRIEGFARAQNIKTPKYEGKRLSPFSKSAPLGVNSAATTRLCVFGVGNWLIGGCGIIIKICSHLIHICFRSALRSGLESRNPMKLGQEKNQKFISSRDQKTLDEKNNSRFSFGARIFWKR
jgi:hypothetical protein